MLKNLKVLRKEVVMNDDYVKIMKCRFCGNNTNSIALHRQLKSIKGDVFDEEPCEKCKERFCTYKYFIGDCGHSGFIRINALQNILNREAFENIGNHKIFRMEKCFACLGIINLADCPTV
jgi:hypothetical protein